MDHCCREISIQGEVPTTVWYVQLSIFYVIVGFEKCTFFQQLSLQLIDNCPCCIFTFPVELRLLIVQCLIQIHLYRRHSMEFSVSNIGSTTLVRLDTIVSSVSIGISVRILSNVDRSSYVVPSLCILLSLRHL